MKKITKYILLTIFTILLIGTTLNTVSAFEPPIIPKPTYLPGPSEDAQENTGGSARKLLANQVLPKFAVGFIGFIGSTALVFLIIGGVRFSMAYGNEEAVEKAKNQIIYALVGLLISLLSYAIVSIIVNLRFTGDQSNNADNNTEDSSENSPST